MVAERLQQMVERTIRGRMLIEPINKIVPSIKKSIAIRKGLPVQSNFYVDNCDFFRVDGAEFTGTIPCSNNNCDGDYRKCPERKLVKAFKKYVTKQLGVEN